MASDLSFVEFVVDQIGNVGDVSFRKMFGEYALYVDGKVVALICDNQLFVKPTHGGKAFIGNVVEAPAYPGAKNSFLVGDKIEDSDWVSQLFRITAKEVPEPKAKKPTPKKPVPKNPVPKNPVPTSPMPTSPMPKNPLPKNPKAINPKLPKA